MPPRKILFVCARSSCRSPMAVGFARKALDAPFVFTNAGLTPLRRIDPMAARVMRRRGFPIDDLSSHALTAARAKAADLIIVLADPDEELGPLPFPEKVIRWDIEDPLGWPVDVYEAVQDDISEAVGDLVSWLRRETADAVLSEGAGVVTVAAS